MIGFVASVYSVRKSEGFVTLMVGVFQGQLGAPVTATFSTYSGTATGDCVEAVLIYKQLKCACQLVIAISLEVCCYECDRVLPSS